jgi:alkylation response protein AidB-like acyl-CoA dehydrogenase
MGHSTLATVRDLAPLIAQHADEAERERRLARPVVDALVNAGLFRLLVPQALGGAGASRLEFCEVVGGPAGSAGAELRGSSTRHRTGTTRGLRAIAEAGQRDRWHTLCGDEGQP